MDLGVSRPADDRDPADQDEADALADSPRWMSIMTASSRASCQEDAEADGRRQGRRRGGHLRAARRQAVLPARLRREGGTRRIRSPRSMESSERQCPQRIFRRARPLLELRCYAPFPTLVRLVRFWCSGRRRGSAASSQRRALAMKAALVHEASPLVPAAARGVETMCAPRSSPRVVRFSGNCSSSRPHYALLEAISDLFRVGERDGVCSARDLVHRAALAAPSSGWCRPSRAASRC